MVANTRVQSGLRSNLLFSNDQIATLLTDGWGDFRDKVVARLAYWFRKVYTFTLAGGVGANTVDLTLIPDLQQIQYVNRALGNGVNETVVELPTVTERNAWYGSQNGMPCGGRRYFADGDTLEILPPQISGGSYEMAYTPQYEQLVIPQPVPPLVSTVPATFSGVSAPSTLGFSGANWQAANIGDTVNVTGATNSVNNGSFLIVSVGGVNAINVNSAALVSEAAGVIAVTVQPQGSVPSLPQSMAPWSLYAETHASIAIRTSRKQGTGELERKLAALAQRVVTMTKARSQGVQQAPITRWRRGQAYGGF
jgi:hypothetical protein